MIRWLSIAAIVILLGAGAHLAFGENGLVHMAHLMQQKKQMQQSLEQLDHQKQEYHEIAASLASDPVAIEQEIRRQLQYVRPDETVFVIQDQASSTGGP